MGTKLLTFLLLALYGFLPPVLCIGEGSHVAIEAASHRHQQGHAAVQGTEISQPHGNHSHATCVDLPLLAESSANVVLQDLQLEIYESFLLPIRSQGSLLAAATNSYFTHSLLVSLHSTVLLI